MILFHGTSSKNTKSIRRNGLLPWPRKEWETGDGAAWPQSLGIPPSVFVCNKPRAGPASSPLAFARGWGDEDGYLVVVCMPHEEFLSRVHGIWNTADVHCYFNLRGGIDELCQGEYDGVGIGPWTGSDIPRVLECIGRNRPDLLKWYCVRDGRLDRNPEHMLGRQCSQVTADCQILLDALPAQFIATILKVYDAKSENLVPKFNPKHQAKEKHKSKSFASLIWNGLKKRGIV